MEKLVRTCPRSSSVAKDPVKAELQSWSKPHFPWTRLHRDFAGPMKGLYCLLMVDAHSNWSEIVQIDLLNGYYSSNEVHLCQARKSRDALQGQRNAVHVVSTHFIQPFPRNLEHSHAAVPSTKQRLSRTLYGRFQMKTRQAEGGRTNSGLTTDVSDNIKLHANCERESI